MEEKNKIGEDIGGLSAEDLLKEAENEIEKEPAEQLEEEQEEVKEEIREKEKEKVDKIIKQEKKEKQKESRIEKETGEDSSDPKKSFKQAVIDFYDTKYRALLYVTLGILLLSMILVGAQIAATGDFIKKDISLKGGTTLTILSDKKADIKDIENYLSQQFPGKDLSVRKLTQLGSEIGIIVDGTDFDADAVVSSLNQKIGDIKKDDYTVNVIGSSLGSTFFKETLKAIYVSFLFMGLVVFLYFGESLKMKIISATMTIIVSLFIFSGSPGIVKDIIAYIIGAAVLVIYFRTSAPSFMMVANVFADLVVTLAVVNLIGMKISTAGIASFLMIIGYCVETNILLTTKLIKKKEGAVIDKIIGAFKTGFVMSSTAIAAVVIALLFTQSEVIKEIMTILLIGLITDMVYTWIQNTALLRIYLNKRSGKSGLH